MPTVITGYHKKLAEYVAMAFGVSRPSVSRFGDSSEKFDVFILESSSSNISGIELFSTIGLSEAPLFFDGNEYAARVELVGACESPSSGFPEMLSNVAFSVKKEGWFCAPGIIFPDVVDGGIGRGMTDVYFARPYLWEDLKPTDVDGVNISWLMAIPIFRRETLFAKENGSSKLEAAFRDSNVNLLDLDREVLSDAFLSA